ncbi:MAG: VWA domain-containing protein [Ruminococcaceae bacterium]|nr:VWA domain-containing protein [Oscillospiraceae bacterium]
MKSLNKIIAVLLVMVMALMMLPVSAFTASAETTTSAATTAVIKRLGGADRYETSTKIAQEGWTSADTVVLASADSYADALAGAPLALAKDAPIMLVSGKSVNAKVMAQIKALGAKTVYLLGGTAAISAEIEAELTKAGYTVIRLWDSTRYGTAVAVAKELVKINGTPSEVFIASGVNYPDALSASSIAGIKGVPILYAPANGVLDDATIAFIKSAAPGKAFILGGTAAIDNAVVGKLTEAGVASTERLGGDDRYDTSLIITKKFDSVFTSKDISIATGKNYPDALAGGAFSAKKGIPVLLTDNATVNSDLKAYIAGKDPAVAYVFGGTSVVSDEIVKGHLPAPAPTTTTTESTTTTTTTTTESTTTTTTTTTAPSIPAAPAPVPSITRHKVSFEANGDNVKNMPSAQKVKRGKCATEPADPTREGYTFEGWYTEAECVNEFDFATKITKKITLYAKWDVESYIVSFDPNAENVTNMPEDQQVKKGECATEPDSPIRENYLFVGWYTEGEEENLYDFSTPVVQALTLFAKWEEYGITEESMQKDNDEDGLSDGFERFIGSDETKDDTDGDGLSDDIEIVVGTDPIIMDSDDDGIPDGDEDYDKDGISNIQEVQNGTNPSEDDSDHDGLNDYEELNTYKTLPLNNDTDGDGAYDGWEIANGFDPLKYDDSFESMISTSDNDTEVKVKVRGIKGQPSSLSVKKNDDKSLFGISLPGYICSAFDFSIAGEFESAEISFEFDERYLSDPSFKPVIYYFNEETQMLEALPTTIHGNVASAVVAHFSTYILLNQTEFDKVWSTEIKKPIVSEDGKSTSIDVVFVVDCSGSMSSYSRMTTAKAALHTFIDALGEKDRAALVTFTSSSSILCNLTTNKDQVNSYVDSLRANGGTAMYSGLDEAIEELTKDNEDYGYRMVIVLSDGTDEPSTTYNGYYASIVDTAKSNDIVVYTVGAGTSVNTSILTQVANNTGGAYYSATVTSGITDAFTEIKGNTVDITTDSNGDSISDYFTEKLCDGSLRLGTGKTNPFKTAGISYEAVQADLDGDFDNDGLLNGQELIVKYDESTGRVYVWMMSDPTSADTDYDGIDDNMEIDSSAINNNNFSAKVFHISGGNQYHFNADFTVDYTMFFRDNTKYHKNLAELASLFALDMYEEKMIGDDESYGYLTLTKGANGTTKGSNGVALGKLFGLNDCVNIDEVDLATTYATLDSKKQSVDADDVAEVFFGHRLVSYQGEQREVIFLMVRGTNGTQAEWSSNFDIGSDTKAYYDMTGEHPDWINKLNHKGFDVAATRILRAYNQYIAELEASGKIDPSIKKSIFISGHSRGAGIANILGAHFEDLDDHYSYVYTMASPFTTTDTSAESYKTIFNIRNKDDLVTYLPLCDWGFKKYGETLSISIEEKYEDRDPNDDAPNTFEGLFGAGDYNSSSFLDNAVTDFYAMTKNRNSFYIIDYSSGDGQVTDGAIRFGDSYDKYINTLTTGKMKKYSDVEKKSLWPGYTIKVTYSPAYVAQNIANLASSEEIKARTGRGITTWLGIDLKGVYSTARRTFILASGEIPFHGGMEHPHIPGSYYLISSNTEYGSYEKLSY